MTQAGTTGADGRASVEAGAGIVADSIAETEDLECRNKAAALLAAVPGARRIAAARGGRPEYESGPPAPAQASPANVGVSSEGGRP